MCNQKDAAPRLFRINWPADMYSLTKNSTLRDLAVVEAPSFAISLVVAQVFFKFGNFTMELMAFLALWFCASGAIKWLDNKFRSGRKDASV